MIKELNASWKQVKPQSVTDVFCKARLCVYIHIIYICIYSDNTNLYLYVYMYMYIGLCS